MQYSNSGTTKYMSFKGSKDYDGPPPKVGFESLASPGQVITVSTAQGFNTGTEAYSTNVLQRDTGINKQVIGTGYTMTTYIPKQFDTSSPVREHYKTASPISSLTNQHVSVNMGTPFAHRSALNHQFLIGGPKNTAFVGTTDLRSASMPSGPAQLTIFYAGSVCVYDDVSPEKAQAIMLLAGNGNSPKNPPNKNTPPLHLSEIPSPTPISVCIPRHVSCGVTNGLLGNESHKNAQSSSMNLPSPMSICSRSSGGSATRKPGTSQVSVPLGARVSNIAVPQARKASLARFLEKRRDRAVTVAPHPCPEKQLPECVTSRSETRSFSITSSSSFALSSMEQK